VADLLAAFLAFSSLRYRMFQARERGEPGPALPSRRAEAILTQLHFTNIHREVDSGTRFLRRGLLGRLGEPRQVVFGIIVYRSVNRLQTFTEWQEEREGPDAVPRLEDGAGFIRFCRSKEGAVFTAAHQALSVDKLATIVGYLTRDLDTVTRSLMEAESLEDAFSVICQIPNLGPFYAYQMTADMVEIGLLAFSDNSWAMLGPGARRGLAEAWGPAVASAPEPALLARLAQLADYGLEALGLPPLRFLGRRLSVKAVEHSLCEYFKFARAARRAGGTVSGRRYQPAGRPEAVCGECHGKAGGGGVLRCVLCSAAFHQACLGPGWAVTMMDWWLCAPCHAVEAAKGEPEGEEVRGTGGQLHCTALHCTALHCTALHCTAGGGAQGVGRPRVRGAARGPNQEDH
jgi:hypothetical protein